MNAAIPPNSQKCMLWSWLNVYTATSPATPTKKNKPLHKRKRIKSLIEIFLATAISKPKTGDPTVNHTNTRRNWKNAQSLFPNRLKRPNASKAIPSQNEWTPYPRRKRININKANITKTRATLKKVVPPILLCISESFVLSDEFPAHYLLTIYFSLPFFSMMFPI